MTKPLITRALNVETISAVCSRFKSLKALSITANIIQTSPCICPGMDKHHSHHLSSRKILNSTLWVVLLTISIATEELAQVRTRRRKQMLAHIKSRVNDRLEEARIAAQSDQAKAGLILSLRRARCNSKGYLILLLKATQRRQRPRICKL